MRNKLHIPVHCKKGKLSLGVCQQFSGENRWFWKASWTSFSNTDSNSKKQSCVRQNQFCWFPRLLKTRKGKLLVLSEPYCSHTLGGHLLVDLCATLAQHKLTTIERKNCKVLPTESWLTTLQAQIFQDTLRIYSAHFLPSIFPTFWNINYLSTVTARHRCSTSGLNFVASKFCFRWRGTWSSKQIFVRQWIFRQASQLPLKSPSSPMGQLSLQ